MIKGSMFLDWLFCIKILWVGAVIALGIFLYLSNKREGDFFFISQTYLTLVLRRQSVESNVSGMKTLRGKKTHFFPNHHKSLKNWEDGGIEMGQYKRQSRSTRKSKEGL